MALLVLSLLLAIGPAALPGTPEQPREILQYRPRYVKTYRPVPIAVPRVPATKLWDPYIPEEHFLWSPHSWTTQSALLPSMYSNPYGNPYAPGGNPYAPGAFGVPMMRTPRDCFLNPQCGPLGSPLGGSYHAPWIGAPSMHLSSSIASAQADTLALDAQLGASFGMMGAGLLSPFGPPTLGVPPPETGGEAGGAGSKKRRR